jgi:hypothetical protein
LSCFHVTAAEEPSPGGKKNEIELLKQRVQLLEEPADWVTHGGLGPVPQRVRQLEELVEKHRDEVQADIKGAYRSVSGAWQLVEQLQKRISAFEDIFRSHSDQLARAGKELQDLRNRQLELIDSDESLEERIEKLEGAAIVLPSRVSQDDPDCAIDTSDEAGSVERKVSSRRPSNDKLGSKLPSVAQKLVKQSMQQGAGHDHATSAHHQPGSWTVHVSLLPYRQQSCPFEKDTTAYKRCLSRGLHRMVAIQGLEGAPFIEAVSRAFKDVLQGRLWEPLELQGGDDSVQSGRPKLKPFDSDRAQEGYDFEFLRKCCATCDSLGRPESLYIAPKAGNLSWAFIKQLPVHVEGLDSSWAYDKQLDGADSLEEDVSEALMLPPVSLTASPASSLKRSISEISLSTRSSASSTTSQEYVSPRSKMARTCMSEIIEIPHGISAAL